MSREAINQMRLFVASSVIFSISKNALQFWTDERTELFPCFCWLIMAFCLLRVAKDLEEKRSHYEPSLVAAAEETNAHFRLDEHDFVPHFQRVSISGEDTSGVNIRHKKFVVDE